MKIKVKQNKLKWVTELIDSENVKVERPNIVEETIYNFDDMVDAWTFFMHNIELEKYTVYWDVSETPDALGISIYDEDGGIITTLMKWNTWNEDIISTYDIHYLYPNSNVEIYHNKQEWEDRINELDPEFSWGPAENNMMVYIGSKFIATVDYQLKKKEND